MLRRLYPPAKLALVFVAVASASPANAGFELAKPGAPMPVPAGPVASNGPLTRPVMGSGYSLPLPLAISQIAPGILTELGPGVDGRIQLSWNGQGQPADAVLRNALTPHGLQFRETGRSLVIERVRVTPAASPTSATPSAAQSIPASSANVPPPAPVPVAADTTNPQPVTSTADSLEPSTWVIEPGLRLPEQIQRWGAAGGYVVDDSGIGSCECRIVYGDTIPGDFLTAVRRLVRPFAEQTPGVRAIIHPNRVIRLVLARDELGGQ